MRELIEYIAKSLASDPDAVRVTETIEEGQVVLCLEVAAEDKGKVIGRQGRVAMAMRAGDPHKPRPPAVPLGPADPSFVTRILLLSW